MADHCLKGADPLVVAGVIEDQPSDAPIESQSINDHGVPLIVMDRRGKPGRAYGHIIEVLQFGRAARGLLLHGDEGVLNLESQADAPFRRGFQVRDVFFHRQAQVVCKAVPERR